MSKMVSVMYIEYDDISTTWTQVGFNGFGDMDNTRLRSMAVYNGKLYVGTINQVTGAEVWEYDGATWLQSNLDGFGNASHAGRPRHGCIRQPPLCEHGRIPHSI